jgi:hypothetical protein
MVIRTKVTPLPPLLVFAINSDRLLFNHELEIDCSGYLGKLKLRGIIYGGQSHSTCRFIDDRGDMWFHDGITTGANCLPEVVPNLIDLHTYGQKKAVVVIYTRYCTVSFDSPQL